MDHKIFRCSAVAENASFPKKLDLTLAENEPTCCSTFLLALPCKSFRHSSVYILESHCSFIFHFTNNLWNWTFSHLVNFFLLCYLSFWNWFRNYLYIQISSPLLIICVVNIFTICGLLLFMPFLDKEFLN